MQNNLAALANTAWSELGTAQPQLVTFSLLNLSLRLVLKLIFHIWSFEFEIFFNKYIISGRTKYQVELCAEKTKLQAFCTKKLSLLTQYQKDTSSLKIGGKTLLFADSTEHVGVIRSVTGNLPNILARFTAHNNALGAVLHTGMARGHHGNPAASIAVDKLYGQPVLFSPLLSLARVKLTWLTSTRKLKLRIFSAYQKAHLGLWLLSCQVLCQEKHNFIWGSSPYLVWWQGCLAIYCTNMLGTP